MIKRLALIFISLSSGVIASLCESTGTRVRNEYEDFKRPKPCLREHVEKVKIMDGWVIPRERLNGWLEASISSTLAILAVFLIKRMIYG